MDRVLGKAGRADTPTDPAPLSMLETMSWSGQYEAMQRERLTIILPVTLACIPAAALPEHAVGGELKWRQG